MAVGENARPSAAQSLSTTLGKRLRIDKDSSIPTDNPFNAHTTGSSQAIWALGFRNPSSFDVQPDTGRIFINDVGQKTWEEITTASQVPTTDGRTSRALSAATRYLQ